MTLKQRIQQTKHFKSLSKTLQILFLKTNNIKHIQHALIVIENTSFENWLSVSNFRYNNVEVIKQLLNQGK